MSADELGEVLFSADEITARVRELGEAISRDYAGRDLVLAGVLRVLPGYVVTDIFRFFTVNAIPLQKGDIALATDSINSYLGILQC